MGSTPDTYRQNGGTGFGSDKSRSFIHLHQVGRVGDTTFGEDKHRFAGLNQPDDFFYAERAGVIDGEIGNEAEALAKEPVVQHRGMNDKSCTKWQKNPDKQAIEKRFMVGNNQ